jgi:hypothetical protein
MKQERGGNAVDSDSLSELERIKGYLGTFMERLSALSEEYETEKASLERAMFATLSDKSVAATQAIVDADFNKRMLVNIVQGYEQVGPTACPALSASALPPVTDQRHPVGEQIASPPRMQLTRSDHTPLSAVV